AQATIELGAAQYRLALETAEDQSVVLDAALGGYNPAGNAALCSSAFEDCIPGGGGDPSVPATGQRNRYVTGKSDCAGRPCMRQARSCGCRTRRAAWSTGPTCRCAT
ncbi:MAG: hypothetical protein HC927_05315, partial [Deltaproteobacteria bacterium]|nr:hypothetical protein [Deltaproteobacteria bacterium]